MDDRVARGRAHLADADQALRHDAVEHARQHFEASLLQFRGPELRLGEAHALRGLADVERRLGHLERAGMYLDAAIDGYQATQVALDALDPDGEVSALRDEASAGECTALVLLGSLQLRAGLENEAKRTVDIARERAQQLGSGAAAAGVWTTLGRAATREGDYMAARACLEKAEALYREAGDTEASLGCALRVAEVDRLSGAPETARVTLDNVVTHAREARLPVMEGRAVAASAGLVAQAGQYEHASALYEESLRTLSGADDKALAAYVLLGLGDARSRLAVEAPEQPSTLRGAAGVIIEGLCRFRDVGHVHGVGVGCLRLGQHAKRHGADGLALALCEMARRALLRTDPVMGVGQVLRVAVKAANGLGEGPTVLALAWVRADLVGHSTPQARDVLEFYRSRAPADWVERLECMSSSQRSQASRQLTERALAGVLEEIACPLEALDDIALAGPLLEAVLDVQPASASSE